MVILFTSLSERFAFVQRGFLVLVPPTNYRFSFEDCPLCRLSLSRILLPAGSFRAMDLHRVVVFNGLSDGKVVRDSCQRLSVLLEVRNMY